MATSPIFSNIVWMTCLLFLCFVVAGQECSNTNCTNADCYKNNNGVEICLCFAGYEGNQTCQGNYYKYCLEFVITYPLIYEVFYCLHMSEYVVKISWSLDKY